MPVADTVLLPLAAGLTLLGLLVAILAGRRGSRGRMVQGIGLALTPLALYLTGLLRLVWDAVVAVARWGSGVVLSPTIWAGFALLALCVVLWVVGGVLVRRAPKTTRAERKALRQAQGARGQAQGAKGQAQGTKGQTQGAGKPALRQAQGAGAGGKAPVAQDDDMAEIEALLKSRGIE